MTSKIEWSQETWNPVTGCTKISAGCLNCYAQRMAKRLKAMGQPNYADGFKVTTHPHALDIPLHWRKPREVFVCSMGDLFHEDVPDEFIAEVYNIMSCTTLECNRRHEHEPECWTGLSHKFMVLTKRIERARKFLAEDIHYAIENWAGDSPLSMAMEFDWPLRNVWHGVTAENQRMFNLRVLDLVEWTPGGRRFFSLEPLLGPIDLTAHLDKINGVIVGGESGPGARPMDPNWARSIRDQCAEAGVPFFFKQWGEWLPSLKPSGARDDAGWEAYDKAMARREKSKSLHEWPNGLRSFRIGKPLAGRTLDGRTHDELPWRTGERPNE